MSALQQLIDDNAKSPKLKAIEALLSTIAEVDLVAYCKIVGWQGNSEEGDYPKQKDFKVAIVLKVIELAKEKNWHIIHNSGFFYIFNGAYWLALEDAEVKQLIREAAKRLGHNKMECEDISFVDKLFQQFVFSGFFNERNYKKQSIINLKNGSLVLDESGVELKPFDYRDFLTHQLDFEHEPSAVNQIFLDYLDAVLPDKDTQKTLQQVAGYLFIKGLKLERMFFLFGTGANGKSVFFEVINGVIGETNISNYSLESLTDDKGYHRAMIRDKIVNYGTDIKLNNIDPAKLKTLASVEPIEARLPYKEPFMMTDYAKLIFNVNRMDSANIEHTHGFFRRLTIIPFTVTISEKDQDRDLHKKILTNKAGVLNWIIEGAKQVITSRDLFVSDECEQFKKQFIKETDSTAMFEEQVLMERKQPTYSESVTNAYIGYTEYCKDVNFRPFGRNTFTKRMVAIGFEKTKTELGWFLKKTFKEKF
jgi:putative DNA primase/helicase